MNDDLVGIGGLLGCTVLLVLYALAIGAKTKTAAVKISQANTTSINPYKEANHECCGPDLKATSA